MLELNHGFRVVDVNARLHAGPTPPARGRDVDAEELERELHQAGVVRAVVHAGPEEAGYLRANNAVARASVDRPFVAFARIDGPRAPGETARSRLRNLTAVRDDAHTSPDDVEQYAYDDRFDGFYLDPATDGLPDEETLDVLAATDLPLLVHAGDALTPAQVEASLLGRGLTVILEGFGGHPLDRDRMTDALDLLDARDDLYLDTAAVRYRDLLERALREHPDRVLFGSGVPDVHPNVAVMELLTLDVPEDLMGRAFEKNPRRVIPGLDG
ncbi:amidohydrolase family protein [Halocalculus aciditolerans]|uniref:Amidohydrolase n=1 Tax=Halocalculus aciditolerans TaxID=1383812 RepID=A0A830FGI9_9EURY|nr:amidohydrolase family protein [Halocalculus aciditolerans]GGL72307.1 amidohydrolase [Halocalculus aciditolerans]